MGILQNINRLSDVNRVQLAIRYPGVPVFRFGSQELEDFHKDKWEEIPLQSYYHPLLGYRIPGQGPNSRLDYVKVARATTQYIVDHGGFLTLQTMIGGQCAPRSEDIELY